MKKERVWKIKEEEEAVRVEPPSAVESAGGGVGREGEEGRECV